MASSQRLYWLIEGYDSLDRIYVRQVPAGKLGENQIECLLQCLTAKAGLTNDEIVDAHLKRRTKGATSNLDVIRESDSCVFMCGTNPYFAARIVSEGETVELSRKEPFAPLR